MSIGEPDGDVLALGAFDVHEVGVGGLYQSLEFVLRFLLDGVDVKKINIHVSLGVG